ncbi:fimbria/pilus outer membrane usher protein [Pseudomonas batumici]|uniref:fimbria/pilus outer membrane usher protein n=1 Tax=Pseudomonas batumici TaxID=226910 RepID=UPI0030D32268
MHRHPGHGRLRLLALFVIGAGGLLPSHQPLLAAEAIEFHAGFMHQAPQQNTDAGALALKNLAHSEDLGPGRYWVEIHVNQRYSGSSEIEFKQLADSHGLTPCLSGERVAQWGLKLDSLDDPDLLQAACVDLPRLVPGAQLQFDASQLRLDVSVPQIAMRRDVAGQIDPQHWDYGINAGFINYQLSAQQGSSQYRRHYSSDDLYLNSGLNLGAWRLRSNQSLRQDEAGRRHWNRAHTYAQRDLPGTLANLTLGETFTSGDIFRSVPIKGAIVASDPGMLADIQQNYAPIIRGVAQTRAKLEIRQNGYPIYATYVSPGPYEIDDLSAVGSGELEVIQTEADGQVQRFTQAYASLGNLLRKGVWSYSAVAGRYNPNSQLDQPMLWQGTLAMGMDWASSLYGGVMASDFYQATTLGLAKDLGALGALALDATHSRADIGNLESPSVEGMSYALKYGQTFASRTNLRFAGYRYSTEGYRDFDEAVRQRSLDSSYRGSRRSRLEASVYQHLGSQSALSLTLSKEDYWRSDYERRQFQFNFTTQHRGVSYNLFASQSLSDERQSGLDGNRLFGLSISLPLGLGSTSLASFDWQKNAGRYSQRTSLSGNAAQNRLNYRASVSHADHQDAAALSLAYQGAQGSLGAGYNQGQDYRNVSLNATGAVLAHADGIEFGPYLGETAGLVQVPDIAGVGLVNATGVETNARGYAVVPYLRPYRSNQLALKTDQLGPEVEIDNGTAQVVPRRGAVVKTRFAARAVTRLMLTTRTGDGQPLPFGAQISDAEGTLLGHVGQAGQVLLSTVATAQTLDARWGDASESHCQLHIDPQVMEQTQGYRLQTLDCLPPTAILPASGALPAPSASSGQQS